MQALLLTPARIGASELFDQMQARSTDGPWGGMRGERGRFGGERTVIHSHLLDGHHEGRFAIQILTVDVYAIFL